MLFLCLCGARTIGWHARGLGAFKHCIGILQTQRKAYLTTVVAVIAIPPRVNSPPAVLRHIFAAVSVDNTNIPLHPVVIIAGNIF